MTVDVSQLEKVAKRFGGEFVTKALNNAIWASIATLEGEAKKESPIDSGRLRSWFQSKFFPLKWVLFNPVKYALFINDWTGIYWPKGQPIIAWPWRVFAFKTKSSWVVFTKRIKWQKPNPFMDRAVEKSERKIDKILEKMTNNLIRKLEA